MTDSNDKFSEGLERKPMESGVRRAGDERLDQILNELRDVRSDIKDLAKDLSDVRVLHYEFAGRFDQRLIAVTSEVKKHSDEIASMGKRIGSAEGWINRMAGKMSAISALFGALGAVGVWLIDHFVRGGK